MGITHIRPTLAAVSASDTVYSSGTVVLSGGANITVGTNGQTITIAGAAAQTVQTQNRFNLTLSGNTSGVLAEVSSGTLTLAGGNNITLSQNGNAITISGANAGGVQTGISGVANSETTYTSGSITLVDLANITIRSTTGQKFEFSVAAQSAQSIGLYASSQTTGQSSSTTADARSLTFRGMGAASVGYSAGEIILSVAGGAADGVNIIAAGTQTANTTGTVVFSNSNGISFGMSNSSVVTASYTVPTQSVQTIGAYAVGNTTGQSSSTTFDARTVSLAGQGIISVGYSAGSVNLSATQSNQAFSASGGSSEFQTLNFANSNGLTFSNSNGSVIASYTVPSVPAQTNQTLAIYVTAQSTGQSSSSTYDARTLSFVPDGIISAGWSGGSFRVSATQSNQALSGSNGSFTFQTATFGNLNGLSLYTSNGSMVGSYTVPTVPAQFSGGLSNIGNTSGDTGVVTGRLVLAGGNNVTLSGSTNAGSMTVTISAGAGAGNFSAGVSNLGNTAGSTGVSGTRLVLVGTNNVSLSQSTDANGATVSFSAAGGGAGATMSGFRPYDYPTAGSGAFSNGTLQLNPMTIPAVTFDRIVFPVFVSGATNSTGSGTLSMAIGFYTSNGATLSLYTSFSSTVGYSHNGTQNSSVNWGNRLATFGASSSLPAGQYWAGVLLQSSLTSNGGSILHWVKSEVNSNFSGMFGVASATSAQSVLGMGHLSASTAALPTSVSFAAIRGTISNARRPQLFYLGYSTV